MRQSSSPIDIFNEFNWSKNIVAILQKPLLNSSLFHPILFIQTTLNYWSFKMRGDIYAQCPEFLSDFQKKSKCEESQFGCFFFFLCVDADRREAFNFHSTLDFYAQNQLKLMYEAVNKNCMQIESNLSISTRLGPLPGQYFIVSAEKNKRKKINHKC